jgi:hypothetical protein
MAAECRRLATWPPAIRRREPGDVASSLVCLAFYRGHIDHSYGAERLSLGVLVRTARSSLYPAADRMATRWSLQFLSASSSPVGMSAAYPMEPLDAALALDLLVQLNWVRLGGQKREG